MSIRPNDPPNIESAAPQLAALADEAMDLVAKPDDSTLRGLLDAAASSFFVRQAPRLRMSYGANCPRHKWYDHWEPQKEEPVSGGDRMRMAQGYVFERLFLEALAAHLESTRGPWSLDRSFAQRELSVTVGDKTIAGHPDAALRWEGKPYAIGDCKQTSASGLKYWKGGRFPGDTWGYLHQAGNYLAAASSEGLEFPYFVWFLSLRDKTGKHERTALGWATRDELSPFHHEAITVWDQVLRSPNQPLPRCADFPRGAPCQTPTGIRCRYLETCQKDKR